VKSLPVKLKWLTKPKEHSTQFKLVILQGNGIYLRISFLKKKKGKINPHFLIEDSGSNGDEEVKGDR
jgi:hypothetical protein